MRNKGATVRRTLCARMEVFVDKQSTSDRRPIGRDAMSNWTAPHVRRIRGCCASGRALFALEPLVSLADSRKNAPSGAIHAAIGRQSATRSSAMMIPLTRNVPSVAGEERRMFMAADSNSDKERVAIGRNREPKAVSFTVRVVRWNNRQPSCDSSSRTMMLMPDCEMNIRSAAREKHPCCATSRNALS